MKVTTTTCDKIFEDKKIGCRTASLDHGAQCHSIRDNVVSLPLHSL